MTQCNACFREITILQEIVWKVIYFECPNFKVDSTCKTLYFHTDCFEALCVCAKTGNENEKKITACNACGTSIVISINNERHSSVIKNRKSIRKEEIIRKRGTVKDILEKTSNKVIRFCTTYLCGIYSTRNYGGSSFDGYNYSNVSMRDDEEDAKKESISDRYAATIAKTPQEGESINSSEYVDDDDSYLLITKYLLYLQADLQMNLYHEKNNKRVNNEEDDEFITVPDSIKYKPCSNMLGFVISRFHKKFRKEWIDYNIFVDISNKETLNLDYAMMAVVKTK